VGNHLTNKSTLKFFMVHSDLRKHFICKFECLNFEQILILKDIKSLSIEGIGTIFKIYI